MKEAKKDRPTKKARKPAAKRVVFRAQLARRATPGVVRYHADALPEDRTDLKRLRALTDAEVEAAARSDAAARPLTTAELKELRRPPEVDVRSVREKLGLSQSAFAAKFGFALRSLQDWEQGRRRPLGPARMLLVMIERDASTVERLVRTR
ncbi:MAG: helix-turn-helix domain-containing protein [Alphaproteobacteria bacterium]